MADNTLHNSPMTNKEPFFCKVVVIACCGFGITMRYSRRKPSWQKFCDIAKFRADFSAATPTPPLPRCGR